MLVELVAEKACPTNILIVLKAWISNITSVKDLFHDKLILKDRYVSIFIGSEVKLIFSGGKLVQVGKVSRDISRNDKSSDELFELFGFGRFTDKI